jgi:putative redox protein
MQVKIRQLEGVRFAIAARSHSIISDQPLENGGTDSGMTPPELLLASLGSCAAFYAAQYLKARNLADNGVEVSVTAEKLKRPARLGEFHIDVSCPVSLTDEQKLGLTNSVHQCLIHNTLLSLPEIVIALACPAHEQSMIDGDLSGIEAVCTPK